MPQQSTKKKGQVRKRVVRMLQQRVSERLRRMAFNFQHETDRNLQAIERAMDGMTPAERCTFQNMLCGAMANYIDSDEVQGIIERTKPCAIESAQKMQSRETRKEVLPSWLSRFLRLSPTSQSPS